MAQKKIKSASDQRRFTMVYHDFMESKLLDKHEKLVFIAIKRFSDNETLQAFPSLHTLHEMTGISITWIKKSIDHMKELGVLKVERREDKEKGHQSNLYTLFDFAEIWKSESSDEVAAVIDEHEEERYIEILKAKGYKITKEKSPVPETDQSTETEPNENKDFQENNTNNREECQEEYTLEDVKAQIDYDGLKVRHPHEELVDSITLLIYDNLNSISKTIYVGSVPKIPSVVKSVLRKISFFDVEFTIEKYNSVNDKLDKGKGYLFRILYESPMQRPADNRNYFNRTYYGDSED